jgi:phosphoribosylanthranilate isomerase
LNQRTRIKLCGLRTARQAKVAAELGVDFVGLVFAERSRRRVTVEEARQTIAGLGARPQPAARLVHEGIPAGRWFDRCAAGFDALLAEARPLVVGVFADQPPTLINAIAEATALDVVQLSGHERWELALQIHRPVIKAIHVRPGESAEQVLHDVEVGTAAVCMLDTAVPGEFGGTGQSFDWKIAQTVAKSTPCMLAGGLSTDNIATAIAAVHPWAVDVSSGIETDGVKDEAKMRAFVQAVRAADARIARGEE